MSFLLLSFPRARGLCMVSWHSNSSLLKKCPRPRWGDWRMTGYVPWWSQDWSPRVWTWMPRLFTNKLNCSWVSYVMSVIWILPTIVLYTLSLSLGGSNPKQKGGGWDKLCSQVLREKTHSHQYLWPIRPAIPSGMEETDPCGGEGMARTTGKRVDI